MTTEEIVQQCRRNFLRCSVMASEDFCTEDSDDDAIGCYLKKKVRSGVNVDLEEHYDERSCMMMTQNFS